MAEDMNGLRGSEGEGEVLQKHPWTTPSGALNRLVLPDIAEPSESIAPGQFEDVLPQYGFRVGELGFLIKTHTVSEVMDMVEIYRIPNTPRWLLGLINLRGNLMPVFDLKTLLELSDTSEERQMLLVLGEGEQSVGMLIDGLPFVPDLGPKLAHAPPVPSLLRDYVSGAYFKEGCPWLELNHVDFFRSLAAQAGA